MLRRPIETTPFIDTYQRCPAPDGNGETLIGRKTIYWHHELPPLGAEATGEHVVEAASRRVPGTLAHRDELWTQCYEDLMAQVRSRLEQEMIRLGGDYARF